MLEVSLEAKHGWYRKCTPLPILFSSIYGTTVVMMYEDSIRRWSVEVGVVDVWGRSMHMLRLLGVSLLPRRLAISHIGLVTIINLYRHAEACFRASRSYWCVDSY